ncbi:MAG: TolC family protein [Candidatus Xenobia bacterium]
MTLRLRMTALFVVGQMLLLALAIGGWLVWSARQADRRAIQLLQATAARLQYDVQSDSVKDSINEELVPLGSEHLDLEVRDRAGKLVVHTGRASSDVRTFHFPLGPDVAVLSYARAPARQALQREAMLLGLLALAALVTGGVGAWLVVGRSLAPISLLCHEVERATPDHVLAAPSKDAELVGLVGVLNDLLAREREALRVKGQFYAAASHELRTPLQALSGHLELSLSRPRREAEYREALTEAHHQSQRLVRLVRDLLLLTQVESSPPPPDEAVPVAEVCRETVEALAPLAQARQLQVQLETPSELVVQAPLSHLDMLVRNLVENAMRYASLHGQVTVRTDDGLHVFEECDVPPDWDAERLFEPFYRPPDSIRSNPEGTGLGLALCRALARAHGWTLSLKRVARGVEAVVRFGMLALVLAAPARAQSWTLDAAEAAAVQSNPSVAVARQQQAQVEARLGQAQAGTRLSSSYSLGVQGASADVIQPPPAYESFVTVTNNFNLNLPVGSKPGLLVLQSNAQVEAARAQTATAELTLRNQVVTAYYDVLRNRALLGVAQDTLAQARRQLQDAEKRQRAGDVPELDVLRAQVPVATAESGVLNAQNTLHVAQLTFNDLVGHPAGESPQVADTVTTTLPWTLPEAQQKAVARSPQIHAALATLRAQQMALAAARLYRTPSLALVAGDVRSTDQTAFSREDSVQALITWPLTDGGLGKAQIAEAQAALAAAQAQLEVARKTVLLSSANAWSTAQTRIQQLQSAKVAADVAQVSYDKTRRGYSAGLFPLINVLDALNTLTQARLAYAQARYDAAAAVAALRLMVTP